MRPDRDGLTAALQGCAPTCRRLAIRNASAQRRARLLSEMRHNTPVYKQMLGGAHSRTSLTADMPHLCQLAFTAALLLPCHRLGTLPLPPLCLAAAVAVAGKQPQRQAGSCTRLPWPPPRDPAAAAHCAGCSHHCATAAACSQATAVAHWQLQPPRPALAVAVAARGQAGCTQAVGPLLPAFSLAVPTSVPTCTAIAVTPSPEDSPRRFDATNLKFNPR